MTWPVSRCSWWDKERQQRCPREAHWSMDDGRLVCHQHGAIFRRMRVPVAPVTDSARRAIERGEVKPWELKDYAYIQR